MTGIRTSGPGAPAARFPAAVGAAERPSVAGGAVRPGTNPALGSQHPARCGTLVQTAPPGSPVPVGRF